MDYPNTSLSNVSQYSSSAASSASAHQGGERPPGSSLRAYYPFVNYVVDPGLSKAVEQTISSRHEKLRLVPQEIQKAHDAIKDYAYHRAQCYLTSGNAERQRELESQLDDLQDALRIGGFDVMYLQAISGQCKVEDILFYTEITLNKVVDQAFFCQEVEQALNIHKSLIVSNFSPVGWQDKPETFRFQLGRARGDSHNQGRAAIPVDFSNDAGASFRVYYKPRGASIDSEVIELFKRINALEEKSEHYCELPEYKILSFEQQNMSIWQNVQGTAFRTAAKDTPLNAKAAIRQQHRHQLAYLDAILTSIGSSDLHIENVIIRKKQEVVPIDLENFVTVGTKSTELGTAKQAIKDIQDSFSSKEQHLIRTFINDLPNHPYRVVLLGTNELATYIIDWRNVQAIAQKSIETAQKDGYSPTIGAGELADHIMLDLLHGDIPYFTHNNNHLHLGHSSDIIMATKQQ